MSEQQKELKKILDEGMAELDTVEREILELEKQDQKITRDTELEEARKALEAL